ncbi:MAG: hypothetical protein MHM6MM_007417 [Cercozoa sp. M6MM]
MLGKKLRGISQFSNILYQQKCKFHSFPSSSSSSSSCQQLQLRPFASMSHGLSASDPEHKSLGISRTLFNYVKQHGVRLGDVFDRLRDRTREATGTRLVMQISKDEAQLLNFLVGLLGAKKVIEVGTFTGYSAMAMALALPEEGKLVACDVSEEYTNIGKPFWQEAGVADKIDLRLAPATETLAALENDSSEAGTYDLVFIDADKGNYDNYYESALKLLRVGGVIAIDNTLWAGDVADPDKVAADASTRAIHELNVKLHADQRVDLVLLPLSDGVTLCRKL